MSVLFSETTAGYAMRQQVVREFNAHLALANLPVQAHECARLFRIAGMALPEPLKRLLREDAPAQEGQR